jgi:hypothetical protein
MTGHPSLPCFPAEFPPDRNSFDKWQKIMFQQRYSGRQFKHDLAPMPPSVLFRLEMLVLEAQQRVQQGERLTKPGNKCKKGGNRATGALDCMRILQHFKDGTSLLSACHRCT